MMPDKNAQHGKKKKSPTQTVLWTALVLGLGMPFALYFALSSEQNAIAVISFVFIAVGMALTIWKG